MTASAGRRAGGLLILGLMQAVGAPLLGAQMRPVALRRFEVPIVPQTAAAAPFLRSTVMAGPDRTVRAPWWSPVASALVPGSGQFGLGQQRSVAYAAAELFLLLQWRASRRDGDRDRAAYRALAAEVARKAFGGSLPLGSWDYYEAMEKFLASGQFDRIPGGGIDPETDVTTYNGARWLLARQTFWRDPAVAPVPTSAEYQRALSFYEERAVRDAYRWSWRDAQLQQDVYRQTIASANRQYQRAVTVSGIIALNHLASVIDAYVNVRLRRFGGVGPSGDGAPVLTTGLLPAGPGAVGSAQWAAHLRWPW